METSTNFWRHILFSFAGGFLYLTSILFAADAVVIHHFHFSREATDLTTIEIVTLTLLGFEILPLGFCLQSDNSACAFLMVFTVIVGLVKGWPLGFGVYHLYGRKLHFENRLTAVAWWYCFVSLLCCPVVIALSLIQGIFAPLLVGYSALLSTGLLIPILVGFGYLRFLRWVLDRKTSSTDKE